MLDLPVRYLHIQLRHGSLNVTESVGPLRVSIAGLCRYRRQLTDNHDGSYVLRIRLWSSCERLVVNVHSPEGIALCDSPIILAKSNGDLLYSEYCDCPTKDLAEWMKEAGCPAEYRQLDSDLNYWPKIDFRSVLSTVHLNWAKPQQRYSIALCHYQIVNNKVGKHFFFFFVCDCVAKLLITWNEGRRRENALAKN
ncbi:unnamed protein product [Gongylonema pulchrum]|uniref:Uncharacterized protein n=1 Tax=Gongylonema pulchrum TaxID=637853 RepID=A0A183D0H6_9BILA|nr:unnamed protein product [Gongylonema pulchrum]